MFKHVFHHPSHKGSCKNISKASGQGTHWWRWCLCLEELPDQGSRGLSSWTPPWASKMGAGSLTIRHQSSRIGETLGPIAQNTTCFWNIWSLFSLEITDAQTIAGTLSESWKADPWVAIPAIQCWPSPLQDICVNRSMWRRPRPKPRRRRT